jgi:hypothetical protein
MREHRHRLTPASRRQDHTTSPSALAPFVKSAIHVHRIPHSTSVTIAKRPSCRGGTARVDKDDLPDGQSGKFFAGGLDKRQTEHRLICPSGKSHRSVGRELQPTCRRSSKSKGWKVEPAARTMSAIPEWQRNPADQRNDATCQKRTSACVSLVSLGADVTLSQRRLALAQFELRKSLPGAWRQL